MTGSGPFVPGLGDLSQRLRAKAGKIRRAVTGYGKTFLVRRLGQPDTEVTGFMWQAKPSGKTDAADPAFTLLGSEAVFLPEAPVLERGFVLIDPDDPQGPRVYTPDNDVQDVGHQHVLLWGRFTPYLEHTRVDLLAFEVATEQVTEDPKTGNPVPVTVMKTVPVRLSPAATDDPDIRERIGADGASLLLVGRWGTLLQPLLKPGFIDWGDRAALRIDGQAGFLTLQLAYKDVELATEQHFGSRFLASWEADPAAEALLGQPGQGGEPGQEQPGSEGGTVTAYAHTQAQASAVWVIDHNLGYKPTVAIFSTGGQEVEGNVYHTSLNQVRILFSVPIAGYARLN